MNRLGLVSFLEQVVNWKLLPGEATRLQHEKGIRWIRGQRVCKRIPKAASRDGPQSLEVKERKRFSTSYTSVPWSVASPCSALHGETWGPCATHEMSHSSCVRPGEASRDGDLCHSFGEGQKARAQMATKTLRPAESKFACTYVNLKQQPSEQERDGWTVLNNCFLWHILNHLVDIPAVHYKLH